MSEKIGKKNEKKVKKNLPKIWGCGRLNRHTAWSAPALKKAKDCSLRNKQKHTSRNLSRILRDICKISG